MAKTSPMFKINQMAKDFGMKTKELCATAEEAGVAGKTTSASLEPDEFNKLFEYITSGNQIKDMEGYLNGKTVIKTPEVVAAEKAAAEKAAAEKAAAEKAAAAKVAENRNDNRNDRQGDRRPQQSRDDRRPQGDRNDNRRPQGERSDNRQGNDRGDRRPQQNRDGNKPQGERSDNRSGNDRGGDRFNNDRGGKSFDKRDDKGFGGRDGKGGSQKDKGYGLDRAPLKPQPKPQVETGVEKKKTGNVRVVDTRTTNVNLSKYVESFKGNPSIEK